MKITSSGFVGFHPDWKTHVKKEAERRVYASPLMRRCESGNKADIRLVFETFWDFVNSFPIILHDTLASVPEDSSPRLQKFLRRANKALSGTMDGMEKD